MALTHVQARNAKAQAKAYKLADANGLFLQITTGGSKLWRMKFRQAGKEGLLSFGPYPEVTLAMAREKRDEARRLIREGKNPALEKRRAAIAVRVAASNTFALIAEEVVAKREREGLAPTTATKLRWYASLLGKVRDRPIAELEAFELLAPLRKIEASGRYETAVNTLSFAGRVFRYAIATGRARRDVAADLRGALTTPKVTHHAAIIDADGAGRVMRSIDAYTGQRVTRRALAMMAHTFPRPGELRLADWREFNFDDATWRIPAARTKMRKEHLIPLSRQAVAILQELHAMSGGEGLVFPSLRNPAKPLSENTLNIALRGMGYGADEMTSHGFRAMASTLLNESGKWNPDAIERALAHGDSDTVRGAYHRGLHWAERVKMMQWWSDYLEALRDSAKSPQPNLRTAQPAKAALSSRR
jgi:integrase